MNIKKKNIIINLDITIFQIFNILDKIVAW